jgi:bifunctional DNase/RNase
MTAAPDVPFTEMRVAKAVSVRPPSDNGADLAEYVVLDEVAGDRRLVIRIGSAEAFSMAAVLSGVRWARPMTYQLAAALVQGLGGSLRRALLDRLEAGAYAATLEVEGPRGVAAVDARASDALNIALEAGAPVFAAAGVLADCQARQRGDSAEAVRLRAALAARPMTVMRGEGPAPCAGAGEQPGS